MDWDCTDYEIPDTDPYLMLDIGRYPPRRTCAECGFYLPAGWLPSECADCAVELAALAALAA